MAQIRGTCFIYCRLAEWHNCIEELVSVEIKTNVFLYKNRLLLFLKN